MKIKQEPRCKTCNDTGTGLNPITYEYSYCLNPDCPFGQKHCTMLDIIYELVEKE